MLRKTSAFYGFLTASTIAGIILLNIFGNAQDATLPFFSTDTHEAQDDVFMASATVATMGFGIATLVNYVYPPEIAERSVLRTTGSMVMHAVYAVALLLLAASISLAFQHTFEINALYQKPKIDGARAVQIVLGVGALVSFYYNTRKAVQEFNDCYVSPNKIKLGDSPT